MSKRSGVAIKTTIYNKFRGVDFASDPSLVDVTRSPWAVNIVADDGGMPEKRVGYRCIQQITDTEKKILGMTYADFPRTTGVIESINNCTVQSINYDKLYSVIGFDGSMAIGFGYEIDQRYSGYIIDIIGVGGGEYYQDGITSKATMLQILNDELGISATIGSAYEGQFGGIAVTISNTSTDRNYLAVTKKGIYRWYDDTNIAQIWNATSGGYSDLECARFAYLNGKLLILTGVVALFYDGIEVKTLSSVAYVPTTIIARTPSGGGETYEGVNYLTPQQRIGVAGDGSSTQYKLPTSLISSIDKVEVNGSVTTAYTFTQGNDYITFNSAPSAPSVSGQDNVFITYSSLTALNNPINKLKTCVAWGINGASDRIVATGNPLHPNYDYISAYNDMTYWSDKNYSIVGSETTAIMGYRRIGEQLAIYKEDNGNDSTIFIRSGSLNDSGDAEFIVKPCIAGVGGVSYDGFGNILDDQMVLTGNGIYALCTNSLTAEKVVENRSVRIDPQLKKEDLSKAIMVSFRNALYTFVDDKAYILDGKQAKNYSSRNDITYTYEAYLINEIPANCIMKTTDDGVEEMYFGTTNGLICKFNHDIELLSKYSDSVPLAITPTALSADDTTLIYNGTNWTKDGAIVNPTAYGVTAPTNPYASDEILITVESNVYHATYYRAINASLATKSDDDGDPMVYKTLLKKGNAVTIKPYARSSAVIKMKTDKDSVEWTANAGTMDIFDWNDIDFERITFNGLDAPQEIPINRKVKNYKRLQIIVQNCVLNEGFGIFGVVKHYVTGNFAKR